MLKTLVSRTRFWLLILLLLLGNNMAWGVQKNTRWETSLTAQQSYANPFQDVTVSVQFFGPSGEKMKTLAFWDGGQTFKIRAAFPAIGTWHYKTHADTEDPGLHNQTGTINVSAYTGSNQLYKHGFIKVSADGRSLEHRDGTPFFWMGDTIWTGTFTVSPTGFRQVIDDLQAKGFTVLQSNYARGKGEQNHDTEGFQPYENNRWSVDYMQKLDGMFDYANDHEIVMFINGLIDLAWDWNIRGANSSRTIRYMKMISARYFGHHISYSSSMDDPYSREQNLLLSNMASEDAEHLYMQHGGGDTTGCSMPRNLSTAICTALKYAQESYTNAGMVEAGSQPLQLIDGISFLYDKSYPTPNTAPQAHGPKPIIQGEATYEGYNGNRAPETVAMAMRALLSGAAGVTHGTEYWDLHDGLIEPYKALPGRRSMGYIARAFLEFSEGKTPVPSNHLIANQVTLRKKADYHQALLAAVTKDGNTVLAYTPDGSDIQLNLGDFGTGNVKWFNPVTGAETRALHQNVSGAQTFTSPFNRTDQAMVIISRSLSNTWVNLQVEGITLVFLDETVELVWNSHAGHCTASGDWTGRKSGSGREVVFPSGTSIYTLTCGQKQTTVDVEALVPGGEPGNAANFSHGSSRITFPGPAYIVPADGSTTVTGWIKIQRYKSNVLVSQFGHNHSGWTIFQEDHTEGKHPSHLCAAIVGRDSDGESVGRFPFTCTRNMVLRKGIWYHFAFVYDRGYETHGVMGIYLNGKLGGETLLPRIVNLAFINHRRKGVYDPLSFGINPPDGWGGTTWALNGQLQEVRIFNYAKTTAQIHEEYNGGLGVFGEADEPGLVSGYHLNEENGAVVVRDYSTNIIQRDPLDATPQGPLNGAIALGRRAGSGPVVQFQPGHVSDSDAVLPPDVMLTISETQVDDGESVVLEWDTTDTDHCQASGAWAGERPAQGSETITPSESSSYTLACDNHGGLRESTVSVVVNVAQVPGPDSGGDDPSPTHEPLPAGNLIPNGDLEQGIMRNGGFASTNPEITHKLINGNHLMRISGQKEFYAWISAERISVDQNTPYHISMVTRFESITGALAYNVFWYDRNSALISWVSGALKGKGTSPQTLLQGTVTSPHRAVQALIQIRIRSNGGGVAYIDNIAMSRE